MFGHNLIDVCGQIITKLHIACFAKVHNHFVNDIFELNLQFTVCGLYGIKRVLATRDVGATADVCGL